MLNMANQRLKGVMIKRTFVEIFYVTRSKEAETANWAIIELQGDLKSKNDVDIHGQFIGDLFYTKEGAPTLIIGQHILVGKEVTLEKPFAVLERQRIDFNGEIIQDTQRTDNVYETEYKVCAIVTKKLLFKTRPKPIVGEAHLKST